MLYDHSMPVCLNDMAIVCCAIDGDACTAGGLFSVYALCGEQLGRVRRLSNATLFVPQRRTAGKIV